ncbi:MAG: transcriptional repressor AgaR [Ignavibacteriaceae bacterium]
MDNNNNRSKDMTLDRRAKIIEKLESAGQVKILELSDEFNVSDVTIRNDLAQLENKGLLIRSRGGAMRPQRVGIDYKLYEKSKRNLREKQAIGKKAVELLNEGDTIIIDSGSTAMEMAKNLSGFDNLTVITNALNIASQLSNYDKIKILMLGGMLRHISLSLTGPVAENSLKNYYCDRLFIGVDGIDSQYGISTPNIEEAQLNRMMIDISKEVIVITDSSKFLRRSFAFIAPMSDVDIVITDTNIPKDELQRLENMDVKVILV